MADVPGPSGVTTTKKEGKDIKPENVVDFYSEDFDPLITLYSNQVILPKPNAKPFDNLAMWNSHYSRGGAKETAKKVINQPLPQRRWLPHQCKYFVVLLLNYISRLFSTYAKNIQFNF